MFTASNARLLSTISRLRLELLILSQSESQDIQKWVHKLKKAITLYQKLENQMNGIIERALTEDRYAITEIRLSNILTTIIGFTSACEYYLGDFTRLLLRSDNLFKRALDISKIEINKFDIIEFQDINKLRDKYKNQISSIYSKGNVWSKKFSNICKLLDIRMTYEKNLFNSLDSLWRYRNKIAHENKVTLEKIEYISRDGGDISISDLLIDEQYLKVCIDIATIMTDTYEFVEEFHQVAFSKWVN